MILFDIFAFPFTAPINGTVWVLEKVREKALVEMTDPDKLRADLIQLQIAYDRGAIAEKDYSEQSNEIWERLKMATANSEGDEDGDTTDEE